MPYQQRYFHNCHTMINHPLRPSYLSHRDAQAHALTITKMYRTYHNANLSLLEDHIAYHESSEYLKRFYTHQEYHNKITLLSEYYQYHQELPRMFQEHISEIIQNYQEDVRNLEYKFVKKKMRDDSELQSGRSQRQKSQRPVEKIIKNIELSYCNFQKKTKKSKDKNAGYQSKAKQTITRDKKGSMPMLPFYQYKQKDGREEKESLVKINVNSHKQTNRNSCKPQNKEFMKKESANNSIDTPKNLSRTKSKSNLVQFKKTTPTLDKPQSSNKASHAFLQKAQSTRNIHERRPLEEHRDNNILELKKMVQKQVRKDSSRKESVKKEKEKQPGMKNMFKKVRETKKMIRLK